MHKQKYLHQFSIQFTKIAKWSQNDRFKDIVMRKCENGENGYINGQCK